MIRDRMKKWILPFMAAALLMQGCADTGAAGTGTAVETAGEEHSEGEARSTILEESWKRKQRSTVRNPRRRKAQGSPLQMISAEMSRLRAMTGWLP